MIARTDEFKEEIKKLGKQIDFKILVYPNYNITTEDNKLLITENNIQLITEQIDEAGTTEAIQSEDIYNVSVVRKGNLLSTMMKEIDFDIKQEIKVGDIIDCSFGLKVNDNYEWIDYGKYVIYSKEFNEDTKTYSYVAYDSMLLTMKDVDDVSLIQGVTVKTAIENICEKVGLDVNITADDTNKYPNLNRTINSEAFNNIEMTYRDVLDMICQALGLSMISDNKVLYLKNINKGAEETEETEGNEIHIDYAENEKLKEIKLFGNTEQDGIPTPDEPVDIKVVKNKNKIKVISGSKSNEYEINLRGKNLFNPNDLIVGEYFDASDGSLMEDYDMSYLNYTEVEEDTNYVYSGLKNITVIYYNNNKEFISGQVIPSTAIWYRLRTPLNTKYIRVAFDHTYDYSQAQIEKGDGYPTEYEPYSSIESCEIGNYQDEIRESTGKNLFDVDNLTFKNGYYSSTGVWNTANNNGTLEFINVLPNTTYTFSINENVANFSICEFDETTFVTRILVYDNKNKTFTTSETTNKISLTINKDSSTIITKDIIKSYQPQLEKGSQATDLEPYGTGIWYKYAEIGKVVLNGSENYGYTAGSSTSLGYYYLNANAAYFNGVPSSENTLCNYYSLDMNRTQNGTFRLGNSAFFQFVNTNISSVADFKTWLSTHNTIIYYPLATPTIEVIEDTTLINQLNNLKNITLFRGTNDIKTISNNIPFYLKLKYVSSYDREEFDAEYLKDKNVKFGKKYMINSVVLSRSEDTDTINRRDEENIALNGVHEFKIKDNLILNFNDREDYIDEIFNQLNGLEYYINDFTSTGITYLEPLDMYNVSIDDNSYQCLLLNDEIKINQGLEENIYTEEPEETTTDYKTSGKTDKEVSFIVDKQKGEIKSRVSQDELESVVEQTANAIGLSVSQFEDGEQVSGATILAQINDDSSQVQIDADKINLNGVVTANNNFKILNDGSMEAKNGKFNGNIELIDDGTEQGNNFNINSSNGFLNIFSTGISASCGNLRFMLQMIENPYNPYVIIIENPYTGHSTFINAGSILTEDIYGENLYIDGTKNRVIDIGNKKVLMNAYETATPYFGDIGSDITNEKGYCKINIEEVFSKTIELEDYKVFIQECGEGNLYVEKYEDYFEVKGTANLKFDWEIKAIQKGYKDTRLDEFKKESDK